MQDGAGRQLVKRLKELALVRKRNREQARLARKRQKISDRELGLDERAFRRLLPVLQVRLQDSIRAGNCIRGTLAYARTKMQLPDETQILHDPGLYLSGSRLDLDNARALLAARQAYYRETLVTI